MTTIDLERTIGELVAEQPGRSRVFERVGVDYCCGGRRRLATVLAEQGLEQSAVLRLLADEDARGADGHPNAGDLSLAALAEHVVEAHHGFLRAELPRLGMLLEKVARVHGGRRPELPAIAALFGEAAGELALHMLAEEEVLFPAVARLEADGASGVASLAGAVRSMEDDHDRTAAALARIRELSGGYEPPADACGSHRAALDGLRALELDLHLHIHEENNVLFPRALALEPAPGA